MLLHESRDQLPTHVRLVELDDTEAKDWGAQHRNIRRSAPLEYLEILQPVDDERFVRAREPVRLRRNPGPGTAVGVFEHRTHQVQRFGPEGRIERVSRGVETTQTQVVADRVHDVDVGDDLRVLGGVEPSRVPVRVVCARTVPCHGRRDLQIALRLSKFPVEGIAELDCGGLDIPLHSPALALADLTNPAILHERQHRQQHDKERRQHLGSRGPFHLHGRNIAPINHGNTLIYKLLHSLQSLCDPLTTVYNAAGIMSP